MVDFDFGSVTCTWLSVDLAARRGRLRARLLIFLCLAFVTSCCGLLFASA